MHVYTAGEFIDVCFAFLCDQLVIEQFMDCKIIDK